jgi:hypothetical protein
MNHTKENQYELLRFVTLLKHKKVEEAIQAYMCQDLVINYNQKERAVRKSSWLKYLRTNLLNSSIKVMQFNISEIETLNNDISFKIHIICKNLKGNLFFTEVAMNNKWKNKTINKTTYSLTSH